MDITVTEIMELADLHAHAKITDGTPAELLPRNLLQCRMQQIVSHVFGQDCELTAARLEIASLQGRVNECGAGAGCCAQAARIAELEAQLEALAAPAQPLHVAAINCPHEIDKDRVVLHYDSKQPGKNALAQLAERLQAAQAQHVHWVTPTIAQMKEYCKQASAMMARDLTRFDAACEVMGYLKEMRAPGYYMHRMNIVLHGNVEGTDAARASDKAPQPPAQAQDALKEIGAIAVSALETNSRYIADWREDMDRIAAIAAQKGNHD